MTLVLMIDFREMQGRPELLALPSLANHTVQFVDLLERETFGFVDHEVSAKEVRNAHLINQSAMRNLHKSDTDEAARAPDEEYLGLEVGVIFIYHVRRAVSDSPIQEPV